MIHSICKEKCDSCHNFPEKNIHFWILIRLKLTDNKLIFIDFEKNRTYCGWDEYINDNNLPEGYNMFYPESGFYDASKSLYQNITPASNKVEKICKKADTASYVAVCGSSILLSGSALIFSIATPIVLAVNLGLYALTTIASSYQIVRGTQNLIDMFKHDIKKYSSESLKKWADLAMASIGFIASPILAIGAITEFNSTVQSSVKALTIFKKSASITQCTLIAIRATLDFIDNNFEITLENVLKLRLDVFVSTGLLMCPFYIRDILKVSIDICFIKLPNLHF